jgi:hypothetical protein
MLAVSSKKSGYQTQQMNKTTTVTATKQVDKQSKTDTAENIDTAR